MTCTPEDGDTIYSEKEEAEEANNLENTDDI